MCGARIRGLPDRFRASRQPFHLVDHHLAAGSLDGGTRSAVATATSTTSTSKWRSRHLLVRRSGGQCALSEGSSDRHRPPLARRLDQCVGATGKLGQVQRPAQARAAIGRKRAALQASIQQRPRAPQDRQPVREHQRHAARPGIRTEIDQGVSLHPFARCPEDPPGRD